VVHAFVLLATLVGLLLLPCVMATLVFADEVSGWLGWSAARRWRERRERRMLNRLDRALDGALAGQRDALAALDAAESRLTIEQIAADLRRLGRLRLGVATRSPVWHAAIMRAYDERLRQACRYLGVAEHLDGLGGMDLEIERVRVEGELVASGLVLLGTRRGQAA
jgi:hypothetical protein